MTLSGRPLLGRERELRQIDAIIASARASRGTVALLEGAAGIGKTALLREATRRGGRAGLTVLSANGAVLEREYPFGVVRQAFASVIAGGRELFEGAAELAEAPLGRRGGHVATPEERCTVCTG